MPRPHKQATQVVDYLRNLVENGTLDQASLTKKIEGIKSQTISSWMTGRSQPTPKNVKRLIEIFPDIIQSDVSELSEPQAVYHRTAPDHMVLTLNAHIKSLKDTLSLKDTIISGLERENAMLKEWLEEHRQARSHKTPAGSHHGTTPTPELKKQ